MWYIAHHGILGQKHGVRNGPPYPLSAQDHSAAERNAGWRASLKSGGSGHNYARKIKKELNRLDTQQSKAIYNRNKAEYQEAKAIRKGNAEKASEWAKKKTGWDDYIKSSEKETWKLIGDAAAAGYDVHSKKALRDVNYGKRMAAHILGGILGGTAYQAMSVSSSGQTGLVEGNKFNVKRSKYGIPSITIDQRSSKVAERQEAYRQDRLNRAKGKTSK